METLQIFEKLSHKERISQINNILPEWIIDIGDKYHSDYPILTRNWKKMCEFTKHPQQKIILVKHIPHPKDEDKDENIRNICDILIQLGYVIRRASEFTKCKKTNLILPNKKLLNYINNNK